MLPELINEDLLRLAAKFREFAVGEESPHAAYAPASKTGLIAKERCADSGTRWPE